MHCCGQPEALTLGFMTASSLVAAAGDGAVAVVILASIVVPLAALGVLCWVFWNHRHDD